MAINTVVTQVVGHTAIICLLLYVTQHFVPLSRHPDLYSPNISTHGIAIAILLLLLLQQYSYRSCSPFVAMDTVVYNKIEASFPVLNFSQPGLVAARSKARFGGRSLDGIAGSNPTGVRDICECCFLSMRGLYDEPIPRPEDSYRLFK